MNRLLPYALAGLLPLLAQQASGPQASTPATGLSTSPPMAVAAAAAPAKQDSGLSPAPSAEVRQFNEKFINDDLIEAPWVGRKDWIRTTFKNELPRYELKPPVRLPDYVVNGKLELSMRQYMDLVLANNTDLEIQRLSVETPRNQISRSAGIFDPTFTGRFNATRQVSAPTDLLAGANTLSQLNQPWNFAFTQLLSYGTQVTAGFAGSKSSTNSQFTTFNPSFNTNLQFGFTQPLLRGRGRDIVKLPITIARSRHRGSQYDMLDGMLRLLALAETNYWNVIEARENLRVQEKSLELADASLKRSQRELELGATSQLDIFQPKAVYANAEIFVTQARFRLAQAEDVIRRQMGVDLDAEVRKLPIVLTEPVTIPTDNGELDREGTVAKALRLRPDLRSDYQALDVDDLLIKQSKHNFLPNLALGGGYTTTGRGGTFFPRQSLVSTSPILPIPGGLGDAFDQMFGFGFPTYNFSLTLTLPLRDRRSAADLADALVAKKRDMLTLRTDQQTARLDVLTAINNLENSKASVRLAQIARDLAQNRVEAEEKKYQLGTSTVFFVLQAQGDLTTAESNLVTTSVGYRRNLLNLQQRTGELLTDLGIRIP